MVKSEPVQEPSYWHDYASEHYVLVNNVERDALLFINYSEIEFQSQPNFRRTEKIKVKSKMNHSCGEYSKMSLICIM